MNIDQDKIRNLLERVTSGNAGKVELEYYPERKACTITWERPRGIIRHESWQSRVSMLIYVKDLLMDAGVEVSISIESTQEDFLPEN